MKELRFVKALSLKNNLKSSTISSFLIFSCIFLTSCGVTQEIESLGEDTTATVSEMGAEIGKERNVGEDITIAPEQDDKVKIRF